MEIDTPISAKTNYLKCLDLTGKIVFKLTEDKVWLIVLLHNLEAVVKQLPTVQKHNVTEALNTFLDHETTSKWLAGLSTHQDL